MWCGTYFHSGKLNYQGENVTDASSELNKSRWQVPAYVIPHWLGRTQKACVVVPVINEGLRIENLLRRMSLLDIDQFADIVIVDGGSKDGSLKPELLEYHRVRGLLVKTAPGKLSAQLRCAYAFALTQGYEHIITIDGNDKDDPEPIPAFIRALEQGNDFVQASRFIDGGVAHNTPKSRNFAIRFIHAPLLRLSSGYPWTDTTQGFRGYSRRMLSDPRLAIFRDVFSGYELLAYMSHRAPRLGFRCIELPTSRSYPEGEIPTKISSVRGNLNVLGVLLRACLGCYNARI